MWASRHRPAKPITSPGSNFRLKFDLRFKFELSSPKEYEQLLAGMGTRERRQRDFEQREQLFIDAARELIREDGLLNLQMARVAERCEYAVGTLYQHFESKEDLVLELANIEISSHADMVRRAVAWNGNSRERIFAMTVADMIFMASKPEHFGLIQYALCEVVWRAASAARRQRMLEAQTPLVELTVRVVAGAAAGGELNLRGQTPAEVAAAIWAQTIGMHNMAHADGAMDVFAVDNPYRLMCRHIQALLNGLEWKPYVDPADGQALDALIDRIRNEVFHDCCAPA
ncbi:MULTISPECIES: TetR/AcrR family transcriptional regulator [Hydrocarboniphaga]|nr:MULTISPECIES: TetR/AcrR family transcriptional regulator [Hydrocarboniphaga]MDZ4081244.1 helix-turn-helix domain-containing protein [Hydrocarboniphaga sp.]